jgi:UDP-sugar transporter A1/2/3
MNYSVGLSSVLIAATVSGLAGVYFEKVLKESPHQASVWIRNIQLCFYSLLASFFGGVIWQDGSGIMQHGFFEGYNWVVWTTIILQAAGGLIASIVIRDADNIVKNFATSISIVVSFFISVWMFQFPVSIAVGSH